MKPARTIPSKTQGRRDSRDIIEQSSNSLHRLRLEPIRLSTRQPRADKAPNDRRMSYAFNPEERGLTEMGLGLLLFRSKGILSRIAFTEQRSKRNRLGLFAMRREGGLLMR